MKCIIGFFLCLCLIFSLCGCALSDAVAGEKQEYIVSSIGFDGNGERIRMTVEAIVVNTDDLSSEKETRLLSGQGKALETAFSRILAQTTQPIALGHNAIIAIGKSVTDQGLEKILKFCRLNTQINISTMLISCENAKKLLSCKPTSSVAVGYDVMSMVEVAENRGTVFANRFYQVESLLNKPLRSFTLPFISVEDKEFYLSGFSCFKDNEAVTQLSLEKGQILSLITDKISSGELTVKGKKVKTDFAKTTYDFSLDDSLKITLNIRLKAKGDVAPLMNETQALLNVHSGNGEDIFGFGNIIAQKKPKLWKKLKNSYPEYFKNAEFEVNFYE